MRNSTLLIVAMMIYAFLLTKGTFNPFGADPFGLAFNSMLDHMLHGRWDVDPAAIGNEAFMVAGHSYAYFGPVPALLRFPLLLIPHWQTLHVERLSCLLAILMGIGAQLAALQSAMADAPFEVRRRLEPVLRLTCTLAGLPLMLGFKGALIYHEAILWAWAFAMLFVATMLRSLQRHGTLPTAVLCLMSAEAGLCLLSRSMTGLGLFVVVGLILFRDALVFIRLPIRWNELMRVQLIAPTAVLTSFLAVAALLNEARWHNPFSFADLRQQAFQVVMFPDRLPRLAQYGLFNLRRLPIGILYYVFPIWTRRLDEILPLDHSIHTLFDAAERPAASLFLTDPLWCVLAICGAVLLACRRGPPGAVPLVLGLAVAPILMLTAWYLAFRYRAEFMPLLFALSCLALPVLVQQVKPKQARHLQIFLVTLCIAQFFGTGTASLLYAVAPFGPQPGYASLSIESDL